MDPQPFTVRRATPDDAAAITAVLAAVTAERVFSAIIEPWPVDAQRRYLESLSPREAFHVAVAPGQGVIAYQSLDLYSAILPSMSHVGQVGTFVHPAWRRLRAGESLWAATVDFAHAHGYAKFVIHVRASNSGALGFYRRLGFNECGRLARQVRLCGLEDDEVILEAMLDNRR